ncbi:MAG: hypothetical protein OIF58_05200 [Cohaesibacter sp.]|nr:hypothetical protein [Cohaesibacter sp.]
MRIVFSMLFFLLTSVQSFAGCCAYGCCGCGCVAAHIQMADIAERLFEIKKGYGYDKEPLIISFPITGDKSKDALTSLNTQILNEKIKCSLRENKTEKLIDCQIK